MHLLRPFIFIFFLSLFLPVLPASAASGEVASIALLDFNRNGKIDRAVIAFANPSITAWEVRGLSGLSVARAGSALKIADAFMASTGDPAVLEVVLDETDPALPIDTSSAGFEVSYRRVGVAAGVTDGFSELASIAQGDGTASVTELDQAAPILVSSTPAPGAIDVLRSRELALVFSEPMRQESLSALSSSNPGGWLYTLNNDGREASIQHYPYSGGVIETFGIAGQDLSGNAIKAGAYPNPFSFRTGSEDTLHPRTEEVFLLTSPQAGERLTAGKAVPLAWYTNMAGIASIRLSSSMDAGQTWTTIAKVPVSQKTYAWYPPVSGAALRLKAEALGPTDGFVSISISDALAVDGTALPEAVRAVSPVEIVQPTSTTASASVRLNRPPAAAEFACASPAAAVPVQISGDRPARLQADLSNLTPGIAYSCAFAVTDPSGALTLSAPSFVAGDDQKAPELIGPAVVSQFDAVAGTARLGWTTNEASTASVRYGGYLNYGGGVEDLQLSASHAVTLSGLAPGKLHQARITSIDAKGNAAVSKDFYFIFLKEGDVVKGSGAAVYWYKNGKRQAFPNPDTYRSWFGDDFSKVIRVPDTQLGTIPLDSNAKMKEGVYLLKIQSDPKTYAVEPGGRLRWIQTESQARTLYGTSWASRVRDVDVSLFTDYVIGAPLEGNEKPAGYAG